MKNFIDLATEAAEALANEYSGEPELEFLTWLTIALQREAMVSKAYSATFIVSQLQRWRRDRLIPAKVVAVLRRAFMGVWAQELAHQSYFAAFLKEVRPPRTLMANLAARRDQVRGQVEGSLLGNLISDRPWRHHVAQVAIVLGSKIGAVPEYVRSLRQTSFPEFCEINGDLEHTAVLGYQRMLDLAHRIPEAEVIAETTVIPDLKRTEHDERYHEALFRKLRNWPPGGGPPTSSRLPSTYEDPQMVNIESVHEIIASAKILAYGADAVALGNNTVEVSVEKISRDPFIAYMRRFVHYAARAQSVNHGQRYGIIAVDKRSAASGGLFYNTRTAKYIGGGAAGGAVLGGTLKGSKGIALGALLGAVVGAGVQVYWGQKKELHRQTGAEGQYNLRVGQRDSV